MAGRGREVVRHPTDQEPRIHAGAIEQLEPLAEKSPDSHHLLNMLARSYEKVGRLEDSHRAWNQSLRITPGQAGVHFRLGRLELTFAERK